MRPTSSWPWGVTVVGKLAIPVIREANGRYRAHLMGETKRLKGHTDMQGFWSKNRDMEPMVSGGFREIG